MKVLKFQVFSKNIKSVNWFNAHFFYRKKIKRNFKFIKRNGFYKNSTKNLTILTSPHIDKDAQEQFCYKIFERNYIVCLTNYKKFLKFVKKMKTERLFDVKIVLTYKIRAFNNYNFLNFLNNFFLDNFIFNYKNKNKKFLLKKSYLKTSKFLKVLDTSGEVLVRKAY